MKRWGILWTSRYARSKHTAAIAAVAAAALLVFSSGCVDSAGTATAEEPPETAPVDRLDSLFADYPRSILDAVIPDTAGASRWVDSTLATMSLSQKIGQLIIVDFGANYAADFDVTTGDAALPPQIEDAITRVGVGGVLVPRIMAPGELREAIERMQSLASVPLLVAADFERGAGRFSNNLTELPSNMAIGATGDTVLAAAAGRLSAIESRALGVNMLLAPVADVNRDADNPIINIRAYGDRPQAVAAFAASFSAEAERWGVLTTLKHFPGHGNTSVDSHTRLATVHGSVDEIFDNDVFPFLYAARSGRSPAAVMTAHVWVPSFDQEPIAATFSRNVVAGVLREEVGFNGLVVTDDVRMGALSADHGLAERAVLPLVAGADVILTPEDVGDAARAIQRAVSAGTLTESAIDRSARRVLLAKANAGLHKSQMSPVDVLAGLVAHPYGQPIADAIATASLTQSGSVKGRINTRGLTILHLANFVGSESINAAMDSVDTWLEAAESIRSTVDMSDAERLRMLKALDGTGALLIILYQRLRSGRGEAGLYRGHRELVRQLVAGERPTVLLSLGSPYDVDEIRGARSALIGYDQTIATARAAVSVLLRGTDPPGALPVASSNR